VASSGLTCILNSTSGCHPGPELREKLSRIFAENDTPARILLASSGAEIPELARRAVKENSQIIVAGGGDGTVNAVASELMGSSITLGVLPLGTALLAGDSVEKVGFGSKFICGDYALLC
jgi:diacylglycerol kinase family enzyme